MKRGEVSFRELVRHEPGSHPRGAEPLRGAELEQELVEVLLSMSRE